MSPSLWYCKNIHNKTLHIVSIFISFVGVSEKTVLLAQAALRRLMLSWIVWLNKVLENFIEHKKFADFAYTMYLN